MAKRKKFLMQSPQLRLNLRLAFIIGASSLAGLVALLLVVFNVSKQEYSRAGTSTMQFINAEVLQDTVSAWRGSLNNPIICLVVETRGNVNPVKLNSILVSLNGSMKPFAKNFENITIWSTGGNKNFSMATPVVSNLNPAENAFKVELNKSLQHGNNYFWITADIKPWAQPNGILDAEINSIVVSGTSYLPLIAAPPGNKKIKNNAAFYSTGNGEFSNLEMWNSQRDGHGQMPAQLNKENTCFFIQRGHELTVRQPAEVYATLLEDGAKLTINSALSANELLVSTGGLLQLNEIESVQPKFEKLTLSDGSNYMHNSNARFPAEAAAMAKGSTVVFTNYSPATFDNEFVWGNVLIDAANGIDAEIGRTFKSVKGNLELRNTGKGILYTQDVSIMSIKGSFIISGGNFEGVRKVNSKLVLNIGGDLIVKSGSLKDVQNDHTPGARSTLNVNGDVMLLGGITNLGNAMDDGSFINLTGLENTEVKWMQQASAQVMLCNVAIKPEKEVFLKGVKMGELSAGKMITVERNAKLWCAAFPVTGKGRFILMDMATIGIGHPKGINTQKDEGNILTAERSFNSGANYIYYSNSNPQETGNFITAPIDGNVRNIIVKKDAPGQLVVLSKDFFVTEQVKIGMGDLNRGNFRIKLSDVSESNVKMN